MHKNHLYASQAQLELFLRLLREARQSAGVTQVELASRLGVTQGIVSKVETGGRKLHAIELRSWLHAINISAVVFMSELDKQLDAHAAVVTAARPRRRG